MPQKKGELNLVILCMWQVGHLILRNKEREMLFKGMLST